MKFSDEHHDQTTEKLMKISKELEKIYTKAILTGDGIGMALVTSLVIKYLGWTVAMTSQGDFEMTEKGLALMEEGIRRFAEQACKDFNKEHKR